MNIIKKVCLLGTPGVGKTSTVARYVKGIYSEAYHSTIGVKIDKKNIQFNGLDVTLVLWDLAGEDSFEKYRQAYLRGASGLIFIADGTRPETLQHALAMQQSALQNIETAIPHILIINKKDLVDQWKIPQTLIDTLAQQHPLFLTSAKTGETIEEAFNLLTQYMLSNNPAPYTPTSFQSTPAASTQSPLAQEPIDQITSSAGLNPNGETATPPYPHSPFLPVSPQPSSPYPPQ
ncbi:MAG: GTP-binding protein [Methylacidiphilales bacterium]|nr:GTP-binding protein [Candidatus Methylacidiphilales bacterium]MDW8348786.1 Rab family GTPase [Verrucomicrobiae bacterium]